MYKFNSEIDFFSRFISNFEYHLSVFKNQPVNFLEIGSLEGRSAVWLLENILTHPQSTLLCIDDNSYNTLDILKYNLSPFNSRVDIITRKSVYGLAYCICETCEFDFIYIDGQHDEYMPLYDLVLSHELLKSEGILCIDDYLDLVDKVHGIFTVKTCVDSFWLLYQKYYTELIGPPIGVPQTQKWLKKT